MMLGSSRSIIFVYETESKTKMRRNNNSLGYYVRIIILS